LLALLLSFRKEERMKTYAVIGLVVVSFAVSLPGMYLLNNAKTIKWDVLDTVTSEDNEDKDDPAVDLLCLKGLMRLGEGQHDKAIAAYSEAIKLDPKYSFSYLGRGDVYLAKGDISRALLDYDLAARLDPENEAAKERATLGA
jgi:tetratricopeptide (TPR) repeat protein